MFHIFPRIITLTTALILLVALLIPQLLWADEDALAKPFLSKLSFNAFVVGSDGPLGDPNLGLQYQFLKTPGPQGGVTGLLRVSTSHILGGDPDEKHTPRVEVLFRF